MVRKGEIREGRLCERGSKRRPYKWPVINERFSDDVVRQSHDLSCTSAVGEMLTDGAFTEDFLLDKIGPNAFLDLLAKALGPPWTDQRKKNLDISLITTRGPMGVTLKEGAFKNHHSLVVDGVSPSGNLNIRDPWEGTKYEMEFHIFLEYWTGHAIYKSE